LKIFGHHINNKIIKKLIHSSFNKIAGKAIQNILRQVNENIQKEFNIEKLNTKVRINLEKDIIKTNDFYQIELGLNLTKSQNFLFEKYQTISNSPSTNETNKLKLMIDEDLLNSLSKLLYTDKMKISISNKDLPADFPFKLNTFYFSQILPGLYKYYPNEDLIITFSFESAPVITLTDNIFYANWNVFIQFALLKKPEEDIFSMSNEIKTSIILNGKEDSKIHFNIKDIIFEKVSVVKECPDIDLADLQKNLNNLFVAFDPFINNYLDLYGIPIPMLKGLKIETVNIGVDDKFISLEVLIDIKVSNFDWIE
jgi:hypothetical protein